MSDVDRIIRGKGVSLGDVCFLYQRDTFDFRFGNIESFDVETVHVTFAASHWGRREAGQTFAIEDIMLATEMSPHVAGAGNTYLANEIVIRKVDANVCEAFAILATQEDEHHPLLAVPVVFGQQQIWKAHGTAQTLDPSDVYRPTLFARILRYIFCAPVHPLFDVLMQRAGVGLAFSGPATLQLSDIDVPVTAHLTVDGHLIDLNVEVHYQIASAMLGIRETFDREQLSPDPPLRPFWSLSVAWNGASHHAESGAFRGTVNLIPRSLVIDHAAGDVIATTAVFDGAPVSVWSDVIYYREAPLNIIVMSLSRGPIPNAVFLRCFGRKAIVHHPITYAETDKSYLAITYLGEPLGKIESAVLSGFIGYITGGRAANVATETFSLEEKLRTVIHDRGKATVRKRPPIPITQPTPYAQLITRSLSTVLEEFARWYGVDHNSFEAIFHHYAEGVDSSYPVTSTLRLIIAFEAFINLVTQDKKENEKIVDTNMFTPVRDVLVATVTTYQAANATAFDAEALVRFVRKLTNLNSGSNTKRIKRFWELVDIVVSSDDQQLIRRLRNASVHEGFLVDEEGRQNLSGSANDMARLCDLLNRAILHYAKYTGPVLSAVDGTWLDPRSGASYQVPPVPHGGTIEITQTDTSPAMTPKEGAAFDALMLLQHVERELEEYTADQTMQVAESPMVSSEPLEADNG